MDGMTNAHRILYTLEGENRYNNNIIELSILTYRDRWKGVCMSETVIRVVRLGKQFRVAGAKENYKTLGKAISQMASSPLRAIQRVVPCGQSSGLTKALIPNESVPPPVFGR